MTARRPAFVPVIDGPGGLIPNLPSISWTNGDFAKISFISGDVLDEGSQTTQIFLLLTCK